MVGTSNTVVTGGTDLNVALRRLQERFGRRRERKEEKNKTKEKKRKERKIRHQDRTGQDKARQNQIS